jgi:hypothetical protein
VIFTERLTTDLLKEAWAYELLISYYRDTNKNQRLVLDTIAGDITMSDEQFVISSYRATQYNWNVRYRATYDELVSTGTIGLITDQELRETAMAIYTTPLFEEITEGAESSEYRRLFRESVSAEIQVALLNRCGDRYVSVLDYDAIEDSLNYPCTLDLPIEKIQRAANDLKALPRFVPSLRIRFADNQTAVVNMLLSDGNEVRLRSIREAAP